MGKPRVWIPQTLSIVLLVIALFPGLPYGYFILLRWVCCAVFGYLAWLASRQGRTTWVWILGVTALLYNPIWRVGLGREVWVAVNLATILLAAWTVYARILASDSRQEGAKP